MKLIITLCFLAIIAAAPTDEINRVSYSTNDLEYYYYKNNDTGPELYNYKFTISDGTEREEHGMLKSKGSRNDILVISGRYTWEDDDGVIYVVTYTADENGFQAITTQKLPKPPGLDPNTYASLLG